MSSTPHTKHPLYGLMAEFHTAEELVEAAHKVHEAGFKHVDAFTPYPIEELSHEVECGARRHPRATRTAPEVAHRLVQLHDTRWAPRGVDQRFQALACRTKIRIVGPFMPGVGALRLVHVIHCSGWRARGRARGENRTSRTKPATRGRGHRTGHGECNQMAHRPVPSDRSSCRGHP